MLTRELFTLPLILNWKIWATHNGLLEYTGILDNNRIGQKKRLERPLQVR